MKVLIYRLFNKISESSNQPFSEREVQLNSATTRNKISLLSKGLKFVPTPKHINKAKIKEEIEVYGRKLRLMRHFRNDHREFDLNPFKKKSKFNPNGDAAIEMYLSRLEEGIL